MENKEAIVYFEQLERQFKTLLRPDGAPTLWAEHVQISIDAIRTAIDALRGPAREQELESENMELKKRIVNWRKYMAPTREQVEGVRGEWMFPIFADQEDANDPRCQCSECGSIETPLARHRFCPSCGAPITDEAVEITMRRLEAIFR